MSTSGRGETTAGSTTPTGWSAPGGGLWDGYGSCIARLDLSPPELRSLLTDPFVDDRVGGDDGIRLLVVHDDGTEPVDVPTPGALPVVVARLIAAGDGAPDRSPPDWCDLLVDPTDLESVEQMVERAPRACASLAIHLRHVGGLGVDAGLAAESALYSTLQAGPEFTAWRESRPLRALPDEGPAVIAKRDGERLVVTLDRPERHNAISARLRDELCSALSVAIADDTITTVSLRGNGPSFCSGGDLDEFGSRPDPATAHLTRLTRSPARLVHRLRDRVRVELHGAAYGGGIEIASFAGSVTARPDTRIALPEISLGLIPGAGGTIGVTRRIGRQRTAWLALTGTAIDARTAARWGLVDRIE